VKLKHKVFILYGLIALAIAITSLFFYKYHFTASLTKLKKDRADVLVRGVETLLDKEIGRVSMLSDDTSAWDTMYRYVDQPTEMIEKDMAADLFIKYMHLSLYIVVNRDQEIIYSTGYDRNTKSELNLEQFQNKKGELWDFLQETFWSLRHHNHLISTRHGIMIAVSSPILQSDGSGPPRGRFITGHLIDDRFFREVSSTLGEHVEFSKNRFDPDREDLIFNHPKFELYDRKEFLEIIVPVNDSHNKHAFSFRIRARKDISKTFRDIIYSYTGGLVLIFLLATLIIYLFINRLILKKIGDISTKTTRIVTSDDLSIIFPVTSSDEISQLKRNLNNMLQRMRDEIKKTLDAHNMLMLNEKMIFLGNVTANIAHEVINPLFAVSNAVEFIRKSDLNRNKKNTEALNIIEGEIGRVREIAMNLNRYSVQKSTAFSTVDLNDILQAAITVAKWSRNIDKITFQMDMPKSDLPIYCNPGAIQQVFINLILNSIDAMEGRGEISVEIIHTQNTYTIDFSDNGPGFHPSILDTAFDSFKSTKNGKGAGLGLYISYHIIKDHGGTMNIDRNFTGGAKINITLSKRGQTYDDK